jgi:hypothetical protein
MIPRYVLEDLGSKNDSEWKTGAAGAPAALGGDESTSLAVRLAFVGAGATVPLVAPEESPAASGGLRLDKAQRRVWIGDHELEPPLSLAQYRLLELLCDAGGRVVSREEVVATVWPEAIEDGVGRLTLVRACASAELTDVITSRQCEVTGSD